MEVAKENNLNKKALNAGIWYIFNNVLTKGLGIITVPIFSRLLSTEQYGIINNFQSWLSVLTTIISLDLYASIQRAKLEFEDDMDAYLSSILTLSTLSCIVFLICSFIFDHFTKSILGMNRGLINFLFIYILFNCAFSFLQMKYRAFLQYKMITILSMSTSVLSVFLSLLLVNVMQDRALGRILGSTLPIFCVSIIMYVSIIIKGKRLIDFKYWKYALILTLPLIPHHLAGNILSQFDRIMIANICGFEQTGLYGMAYNIGGLLSLVWVSFNGAWTPWFYEQMKVCKYTTIKEVSKYYILIFWIIDILLVAFSPEIMRIMAPTSYYEAIYVIPPVILGIFFQFIYSLYVNIEFYYKNNMFIPVGTMASAIINVVLNAIFIPRFGYISAAFTTFIGYAFLFLFHYLIAHRMFKEKIYPAREMKVMVISNIIITVIYMCLYQYNVIRYFITLLIGVIVVLIVKKDINGINKMINILKTKEK